MPVTNVKNYKKIVNSKLYIACLLKHMRYIVDYISMETGYESGTVTRVRYFTQQSKPNIESIKKCIIYCSRKTLCWVEETLLKSFVKFSSSDMTCVKL